MANQTITQLPDAGPITGTELVPIVQNGGTYKTTTAAIAASPSQTQTFLTKDQELTLPNSRYLSTGTGLGLTDGGATSFYRISLNGASGSLEAASSGIIVKNGSTSVVARTLETSGNGLSVSNGDGTGANPTFQLTGLAAAIANLGGTGMLAVVGGATIAGRQILGTANQIGVSAGNGSGNPTISIADDVVLPGTGAMTVPSGTTAEEPVGAVGQFRFNTTTNQFYGFNGSGWQAFSQGAGVDSFSAGGTGFTPSSPTTGPITLGGVLNVDYGGTGAISLTGYVKGNGTSAMTASATIPNTDVTGLGTMSTQNSSNVAITGGTASGVAVTGSTINSTTIGGTTPADGTFTSVTTTTGTVSTTPVNDTDLVNKLYVDNQVAAGIDIHPAVRAEFPESLGNIPATYNNGTAGVGATLTNTGTQAALVVDGVTMNVNDRVLVYNQTNAYENGVYTVTNVGSGSTNWVLTRATDANTYGANSPTKLGQGSYFFVQEGATGAGEAYVCNTVGTITFGVTAITFALFSQSILYTAGTGLTLSPGYQFSITPVGTASTYGSASQVPVFTTNASGQVTGVTNTSIAISAGAVSGLAPSATTNTTNATNITSGTLPTGRLTGSYTGITAVGTLTGGTWNATAIGVGYGGTGLTATPTAGQLPIGNGTGYTLATLTAGTNVSISNTAGGITINATPAAGGTVTSVDVSGGTTGLTFSGGPITVSGTITMAGTLGVANGGTGATSLTGYVKGNGTSTMTASATIPSTDITGLGTMSTQNANSVAITGGAIDGTAIGATTVASGKFSTLETTSNAVISVNSASDALRITQTGVGNALLVEDSANPDSTPFVIDASGRIIQGYTTAILTADDYNGVTRTGWGYQGNGAGAAGALFTSWNTGVGVGAGISLSRSKSATIGTQAIVASGDSLGGIGFNGDDGTSFISAASIASEVDGTPGTNDMPGRLVFSTTADGASTPTERMRIDSAGKVGIGVTPISGATLSVAKAVTGATTGYGVLSNGQAQSDVTSIYNNFHSAPSTQATTFTLTDLRHYNASQGTIGAGSTVTNQFGFHAGSALTGATNNYGFYSAIAAGTGRWNFYAAGTAGNYMEGALTVKGGISGGTF